MRLVSVSFAVVFSGFLPARGSPFTFSLVDLASRTNQTDSSFCTYHVSILLATQGHLHERVTPSLSTLDAA